MQLLQPHLSGRDAPPAALAAPAAAVWSPGGGAQSGAAPTPEVCLLDFLLRILPANVQLQLRLLYCCSSFQAEVEEFKPLFSMQAQGRRQPELAPAEQR